MTGESYQGKDLQPYKFGGKEEETMFRLNQYDFAARTLDEYGRFTTIDPMAEKYYSVSPYAYCGNNPILNVDPMGMDYTLYFTDNEVKENFTELMNKQLEGQFTTTLTETKNGLYTLGFEATKDGGNLSKMSEKGQAFYNEMMKGIENHSISAQISVVSGSKSVQVGRYDTQQIDIADIAQFSFERGHGATQAGKIVHEFVEQFGKVKNIHKAAGYNYNHRQEAIPSENLVNGNTRLYGEEDKWKLKANKQFYREQNGIIISFNINTNKPVISIYNFMRERR